MTIRELLAYIEQTVGAGQAWFADGWGKLVEFNILDLTVGQGVFTVALIFLALLR